MVLARLWSTKAGNTLHIKVLSTASNTTASPLSRAWNREQVWRFSNSYWMTASQALNGRLRDTEWQPHWYCMAEHAVRGSEGCGILTMRHCPRYILHPGLERPSIGQKGFDSPESLIIGCCSRWKDSEHRRPKKPYDGLWQVDSGRHAYSSECWVSISMTNNPKMMIVFTRQQ